MIQTGPNYTNQLSTSVNNVQPRTLIVTLIPFLGAVSHLGGIVQSKGKTFEMMMSGNGPRLNEVLKGKAIKGPFGTAWTFGCLVHIFGSRASPSQIVASSTSILVIIRSLKLLEALHLGVIDILGEGDKSGRRRSIGSRHFKWRTG